MLTQLLTYSDNVNSQNHRH